MADLPVGSGGRRREQKIDKDVERAAGGDRRHPAARGGEEAPRYQKPRYVPSEREKKTRQYGTPVGEKIVD